MVEARLQSPPCKGGFSSTVVGWLRRQTLPYLFENGSVNFAVGWWFDQRLIWLSPAFLFFIRGRVLQELLGEIRSLGLCWLRFLPRGGRRGLF